MRKIISFLFWIVLLAFVFLDRLATLHTLPDDLQSFWETRMSGLTPYGHIALALTAVVTLYLYWPLLERWMPRPSGADKDISWIPLADASAQFIDILSEDKSLSVRKSIFSKDSSAKDADGPSWALRRYIFDFASDSVLRARGTVKGGRGLVIVPKIAPDDVERWIFDDITNPRSKPSELKLLNGQEIVELEIHKDSLSALADRFRAS